MALIGDFTQEIFTQIANISEAEKVAP